MIRSKLAAAAALLALIAVSAPQQAGATHLRPKGATPTRVSLVPAFEPCTAPHAVPPPPLALGSCTPPLQSSLSVTVGTPDVNGAAAMAAGSTMLKTVGSPG